MRVKKICEKGHAFYKSSDCRSCPTCEQERKATNNFLDLIYAPARRALASVDIYTLEKLAEFTEAEIMSLHGMGKATMPILREELSKNGLSFKKQ